MQTFLPYPDFRKSLECLDYRRLGKQRVESKQIIDTLTGVSEGWKNHPAVKMWSGHVEALKTYYDWNLYIWEERGYRNIKLKPFRPCLFKHQYEILHGMPEWFGGDIHSSHRSALLYKKFEFYSQYGWTEEPKLDYVWPIGV